MTIPTMHDSYRAQPPAHYAAHFKAKADEAREQSQAAAATGDTFWQDLCARQVRFWLRQAERVA